LPPADPRGDVYIRHISAVYCDRLGELLASSPPGIRRTVF
jgi:hypothetical protein